MLSHEPNAVPPREMLEPCASRGASTVLRGGRCSDTPSLPDPDGAGWKLDGTRLHLSKIGTAKIRMHRELQGKIKTVTVKREVDQWFVCFSCEVHPSEPLPVSYEEVGIDLYSFRKELVC